MNPLMRMCRGVMGAVLGASKVVPDALLDFCFNVMRSAFSVTLNRPVYAFKFDRFMDITPAILDKVRAFQGKRSWSHSLCQRHTQRVLLQRGFAGGMERFP